MRQGKDGWLRRVDKMPVERLCVFDDSIDSEIPAKSARALRDR